MESARQHRWHREETDAASFYRDLIPRSRSNVKATQPRVRSPRLVQYCTANDAIGSLREQLQVDWHDVYRKDVGNAALMDGRRVLPDSLKETFVHSN